MSRNSVAPVVIRACHPFRCRLPPNTTYAKNDPASLVGTGLFSIAMTIFTAFRTTPAILLTLMQHIQFKEEYPNFFVTYCRIMTFTWLALFFVTLIISGIVMVCSGRIRKRSILLFQPWALLLLYFDGFFWLSITILLHVLVNLYKESNPEFLLDASYHLLYLVIIYIDIVLFLVMHYLFATYYIIAELTVIENCF